MANSTYRQRALVDILLTILTALITFFQKRYAQKQLSAEEADSESTVEPVDDGLTKAQRRRLQRAAQKAKELAPTEESE